jgi:hypothetical protein
MPQAVKLLAVPVKIGIAATTVGVLATVTVIAAAEVSVQPVCPINTE